MAKRLEYDVKTGTLIIPPGSSVTVVFNNTGDEDILVSLSEDDTFCIYDTIEDSDVETDDSEGDVDAKYILDRSPMGLVNLRFDKKWSQEHLGNLLGLSRSTISRYESGKTPIPYWVFYAIERAI